MSADFLSSVKKAELAGRDVRNFDLHVLAGKVELGSTILDQFYVAPDVLVTRNGIRELDLPRGHLLINQIELTRQLGKFGAGLQYEIGMAEVGKFELPGSGKRRSYSLLAHNNIQVHPHFMVWYPGFGHSLVAKSTKWEMAIQAQIAHTLGVNILCVNPGGRGVPASGSTRGVANISAATMIEDTIHTTDGLIDNVLARAKVPSDQRTDVIVTGHSLGAALARAYAYDIATRMSRRILRGLIQEAPVGADTCEDIMNIKHIEAIAALVPECLARTAFTSRGMQLKIKDLIRLFYGENCSPLNAALSAWGLTPGEARNFLDLSLLPGDLERFIDTVTFSGDSMKKTVRGVGSQIIYPSRDAVFFRGPCSSQSPTDKMWLATCELGTTGVRLEGPHCFVTPDPTDAEKNAVRNMYKNVFKLRD